MAVGYRIGQALAFVIILCLVVISGLFVIYGLPWLFREIFTLYNQAETEFKLGLLTAVLSTAGVVWSVLYQRRKEIEALNFERKREAYAEFFDLLFEFMDAGEKNVDLINDPQTKTKFRSITKKMMAWGSAETINAFNKFQVESSNYTSDEKIILGRAESLLLKFRKDLGHNDRKLAEFGLTKLIIRADEHHKL